MELINPVAESYAKRHSSVLDHILTELEARTLLHHPHAQMLSGQVQGKFLQLISCMIKPKRILEIGTFTGYSALCLSSGLQENGVLHTIELREEDALTAKGYFQKAGVEKKIQLHQGDALSIIPSLKEEWDLVFIDADKVNYLNYYELTLPKVKSGGWLLADNVLFQGEVLQEPVSGKNARAIDEFNKHVSQDDRVEQVMLTVRDGLLLIQKT